MDKKRVEIIITAILILIFIFGWANNIKILKKRAGQKTGSQGPISSVSTLKPSPIQMGRDEKYREEKLTWVRDPFSGKIYTSGEGSRDLKLDGIIWDKKEPLAMINECIVRVGDEIGESKIIDIKPDRVILNDGTRDFELRLGE